MHSMRNITMKSVRTRPRKFRGRCEACGKPICACKAYQHTDDSNGAINANAKYLCRACYEKEYGVKIPTEVEAYKLRLIDKLRRCAMQLDDEKSREMLLGVVRLVEKTD